MPGRTSYTLSRGRLPKTRTSPRSRGLSRDTVRFEVQAVAKSAKPGRPTHTEALSPAR